MRHDTTTPTIMPASKMLAALLMLRKEAAVGVADGRKVRCLEKGNQPKGTQDRPREGPVAPSTSQLSLRFRKSNGM
jgi:hypothetical protein